MKKIYSFKESYIFGYILKKSREVLEEHGYKFLRLPSFDTDTLKSKFISVLNTKDDEIMFLRNDFTYQIIKHFDAISEITLPMRIYYEGSLFGPDFDDFETYQIGFELIGIEDVEGDFEIIYCLFKIFKSLNMDNFIVVISNPSFIDRIIEAGNFEKKKVESILKNKNVSAVIKEFSDKSPLQKLMFMQGDKHIIDEALSYFPEGERELLRVGRLAEKLDKNDIPYVIDLSYVRRMPYYNGITFEILKENAGFPFFYRNDRNMMYFCI